MRSIDDGQFISGLVERVDWGLIDVNEQDVDRLKEIASRLSQRTHTLKSIPRFFMAVLEGCKTFDIRRNDRDFRLGDRLILQEYRGEEPDRLNFGYTGRELEVEVTYITDYEQKEGFVVMAVRRVYRTAQ